MKAAVFLLVALSTTALGSTSSTVKLGDFVLVNADGSMPAGFDPTTKPNRFASLDLRRAAAEQLNLAPQFKCNQSNLVTITHTCADEKAPHIAMPKNSDGGYDEPDAAAFQDPKDDTQWRTLQWLYIHNAKWPDGWPNCWVRGWENPDAWRTNAIAPPNVFKERIEPGMAELIYPDVMEPVCKPDGPHVCPGVPLT